MGGMMGGMGGMGGMGMGMMSVDDVPVPPRPFTNETVLKKKRENR
jgi:hypothetical protein